MTLFRPSIFLRRVLLADAAVGVACGLLMLFGQAPLSELLGLPVELLHYAGLLLLPFAAILVLLAMGRELPHVAVWAVIVCNVAWAVDCVALLSMGWVSPTLLGQAFIVAHIVAVLVFAELEYVGMRRPAPALAAA